MNGITLKKDSAALIVHADGKTETILPPEKENTPVEGNQLLVMALSFFLRQPKFVNAVITDFKRVMHMNMTGEKIEKDEVI